MLGRTVEVDYADRVEARTRGAGATAYRAGERACDNACACRRGAHAVGGEAIWVRFADRRGDP